jgi:hypothetical protein
MHILALTDAAYQHATRRVVGPAAQMWICPPLGAADMSADMLTDYDFVYLDLHGQADSIYLYCGARQRQAALAVWTVRQARLAGAVVFATTCYLPQTPFLQAFLEAGAQAVIAGDGQNFGTRTRLSGAQVLARLFLDHFKCSCDPAQALEHAKQTLRTDWRYWLFDWKASADALAFRLFSPGGVHA